MNDEHNVAIVSFAGAIKREIKRIRRELQKVDELSTFSIEISASGRVHDGDIKLEYAICENEYGGGRVKGDDLDACLEEMLRRHGWEKRHAVKAIAYDRIPSDDTEE